ncbi:MAG: UDP-N-acetylmuramoyl-tripeptide--D-alanyl-D-alanine ligase [Opitutus sp.]
MRTPMPEFPAGHLAQWTRGRWTAEPVTPLTGFSIDTRQLRQGQVFVAIKTDRNDGHHFLAEAQEAGAGAALVAQADPSLSLPQLVVADPLAAFQAIAREHRRSFPGKVVGISGSAGKTSTKDLLAILLGGAEEGTLATEGNLNNHLGVPLTLTRLDPARHAFAVIEAGVSEPGEMKPLADMIEPDVSLITLVAEAHTEGLGGIAGVAREKAVLPAATRASGIAIFPREAAEHSPFRDLGVRTMIVERAEVVRPAEPPKDRVYFSVTQRAGETAVALAYGPPPPMVFHFRRVSDGMAQNAALAICVALWLGISRDAIQDRLAKWQPARLRGEIRHEDGRLLYLDCYNANPASMLDALATFAELAPEGDPRLYVLGCMEELGAGASRHHHDVGRAVPLREVDRLFAMGSHAHDLCAGVLARGNFSEQIQIVSSLDPIAACFAEWRGAVFVKGSRRHHLERILEVQTCLPLA